jgi:peptidoglycan/LPS O-acetylase OafA/YrhL
MRAPYVPALDGIRGVAIIWVVLHNATDMPLAPQRGVLYLLYVLAHPGWIGVQLFFALSGFLITAGLLASQGSPHYFRNFYAKRALRILPLYYAVLFALLVLAPRIAWWRWPFNTNEQASLWLFTVNWTHTAPYGFAHFWSLAIEEQFYLLWPLVVYKLAPRRLLSVCLWIAVGATLLRCLMVLRGADPWTLYTATACRMDALALGGAAACLLWIPHWRAWIETRSNALALGGIVLFLAGIPLTHIYDRYQWAGETLGYALLAICSATLVIASASPDRRPRSAVAELLSVAPLRSIGKYSYAMYIFHGLLHKLLGEPWLVARFGKAPPMAPVLLYSLVLLAVTYALAFVSYHTFEKRFLLLKGRFESPAVAPPSVVA